MTISTVAVAHDARELTIGIFGPLHVRSTARCVRSPRRGRRSRPRRRRAPTRRRSQLVFTARAHQLADEISSHRRLHVSAQRGESQPKQRVAFLRRDGRQLRATTTTAPSRSTPTAASLRSSERGEVWWRDSASSSRRRARSALRVDCELASWPLVAASSFWLPCGAAELRSNRWRPPFSACTRAPAKTSRRLGRRVVGQRLALGGDGPRRRLRQGLLHFNKKARVFRRGRRSPPAGVDGHVPEQRGRADAYWSSTRGSRGRASTSRRSATRTSCAARRPPCSLRRPDCTVRRSSSSRRAVTKSPYVRVTFLVKKLDRRIDRVAAPKRYRRRTARRHHAAHGPPARGGGGGGGGGVRPGMHASAVCHRFAVLQTADGRGAAGCPSPSRRPPPRGAARWCASSLRVDTLSGSGSDSDSKGIVTCVNNCDATSTSKDYNVIQGRAAASTKPRVQVKLKPRTGWTWGRVQGGAQGAGGGHGRRRRRQMRLRQRSRKSDLRRAARPASPRARPACPPSA